MVHDHVSLGRKQPGLVAHRNQRIDFRGLHRDWFFAQDMLARLHRLHRPFDVKRIWQRYIDRVDARIFKQIVVRPMYAQIREIRLKRRCLFAG